MSRVGKLPIKIPQGVQVKLVGSELVVKGPKGELKLKLLPLIDVKISEQEINIALKENSNKKAGAFWGLFRNLINNLVVGVSTGFEKKMEIKGVGYRASVSGQKLILNLGFSHPVNFDLPSGIKAVVEGNFITLSGADKQLVGETAAQIRRWRQPEPYKGKGIRYVDEVVRKKAGKTAASK